MWLLMWINTVYDTGIVLPHNKVECNSVYYSSAHLGDAGTGLKSNLFKLQQVSCEINDHLLVTQDRDVHKVKQESAHNM